jgi:hypothetical protein
VFSVIPPLTPIKPIATGEGSINPLSWDLLADHYEVDVLLDGGDWQTESTTFENSPAIWDNLSAGSRIYRIRACSEGGVCSDNSPESDAVVTSSVVPDGDYINFNEYALNSYSGPSQDVFGNVSILDEGLTLDLQGNTWKQIAYSYNVTSNTIIEFDFSSNTEGELHNIGFDTQADTYTGSYSFNLFGRQNCTSCVRDYRDYPSSGGTRQYRIPVGKHFQGQFNHLTFGMDEDRVGYVDANSRFSNIRIYESGTLPVIAIFDDKGPDITKVGSWWVGTNNPAAWDRQYQVAGSANFKFTHHINSLPASGLYEVYAWWTAYAEKRKDNVKITIGDDSGASNYYVNQKINGSRWNRLGVHTFTPNNNGYVTTFGQSGSSAVSVDAVRLVFVGDSQSDLVNVSYTGSDNSSELKTTEKFIATATPISGNEALIQSVSFSINNIDWFDAILVEGGYQYNFEYLTAGDYALYARVNGVDAYAYAFTVFEGKTYIIDDSDANVVLEGTWNLNSNLDVGEWGDTYYASLGANRSFSWTLPNLPEDGVYEMYAWWVANDNRSDKVPVDVVHDQGISSITIDQQNTSLAEKWNLLGTYSFTPGTDKFVKFYGEGISYVSADAIRLIRKGDVGSSLVTFTYPGSDIQGNVPASENFVVTVSPSVGNEDTIQLIELSLDGETWLNVLSGEFDFGLLDSGDYTLYIRVNGGYVETVDFIVDVPQRRVIFIHTDLLGSPAAETNEQGGINQ